MIYGWFTDDLWMVYGWFMDDLCFLYNDYDYYNDYLRVFKRNIWDLDAHVSRQHSHHLVGMSSWPRISTGFVAWSLKILGNSPKSDGFGTWFFTFFFGNLLLVLFRKWLVAPKMDVFTPRPSIPSGGLLQAQCEFQDPKLLNWRYGTRFFVRPIKGGSGWWFQTWMWFSISYMGCHHAHWLSYFSGLLKPPTRGIFP